MAHLYVNPANPLATLEHQGSWLNTGMTLDNFAWGFPLWLLEPVLGEVAPPSVATEQDSFVPARSDPLPALGNGESLADTGLPIPVGEPVVPFEELCWIDVGTGRVKCWTAGSIWAPGETYGPPGEWIPESEAHPPPINPEYLPTETVFEEPAPVGDADVAFHENLGFFDSLGDIAAAAIGGLLAPSPAAAPVINPTVQVGAPAMQANCPTRKTRTLTIDCATGLEVKRTRRRRRRLLTSGDLGDLAQLQALVGKGSQAMQVAVSKAIR